MNVIKKDGTIEEYNEQKIINACNKAARRAMVELSEKDYSDICSLVWEKLVENDLEDTEIYDMHNIVESVLEELFPEVARRYREYRNYKKDFIHMMDKVYSESQSIRYIGDKSNANTDSALVATKRSLIYNTLNKELYKKFFLTKEEKQASKEGYIYIHDMSARLDTFNCCLFNIGDVIENGFEMGNLWYNEPKTIDTFFDVLGDVILSTAAQQYGGFTVPEIDKTVSKYAKKSYDFYYNEYLDITGHEEEHLKKAEEYAMKKVERDFEQGWQGIEIKLNSVGSSRGDYPFVTMTLGLATDTFGKMASKTLLKVHSEGQGKPGFKRPVLFPKIVFLYDIKLHGGMNDNGEINRDVFEAALECSSKTMYPDYLSLSGNGYVAEMYKKYGKVVSPMGCRAFLSPWYVKGGMHPADENDKPIFEGRCNLGVISLNLPMILAKSRQESKDFYEVLNYYLEMIRKLHKRTYDYIGELKASVNPIAFCEGGLYNGYLKPDEKIKTLLPPMTMSYGVTALNELQRLYNGKSIREDGNFALEVMRYIQNYVDKIKVEDKILYAIYGTPAESLCFSGDTVVQTLDGDKFIKDITVDDFVYSYNEDKKKIELKPVLNSICTLNNAKVIKVNFTNGQSVICTPNHPFAIRTSEEIRYVEASELKPEHRIKSNNKHYQCIHDSVEDNKVASIEWLDENIPVYDITVADNHNFYVGGKNGILVHNCGLQVEQFRKLYGIIENVSDKSYVSNSFHCHVSEDINPIEKQDKEYRFWNYFNGGKIQYCRYNLNYNTEAIKTLVVRAMEMGLYEGVNLSLCYCEDCGYQQVEMDVCPKCGSSKITKIDRMNGYLGYTRVKGDTRYNKAKNDEILDRVSM